MNSTNASQHRPHENLMILDFLGKRSIHAWPVYGLCAFLPLSIAGIGIFKLFATLAALLVLVIAIAKGQRFLELRSGPTVLALCMLGALAASLSYTSASTEEALNAFAKYGKLLLIPAVALLIRSREQAITALRIYFCTQSFVLVSSWLLFAGLTLPWAASGRTVAVVYSGYLDQAILTAGFAALVWHLRAYIPTRHGSNIGIGIAALASLNLLFALPGRSGQVCLIAAAVFTIWWAMPRKLRPFALLTPILIIATAMVLSPQFNQRYKAIASEISMYHLQTQGYKDTSSGLRLDFWSKSLNLIAQQPILGFGVGSWRQQYWRMEAGKPSAYTSEVRNPHQEYLFWGVQLGLLGIFLLLAWQGSFWREARKYKTSEKYAIRSFLIIFMTACFLNSALFDGLVGDYFCTLLAVLLALGRYTDPIESNR
jgi:O-antigen ligase